MINSQKAGPFIVPSDFPAFTLEVDCIGGGGGERSNPFRWFEQRASLRGYSQVACSGLSETC